MKGFKWILLSLLLASSLGIRAQLPIASGAPNQRLLNEAVDISEDFRNFTNTYFIADNLEEFDPVTGKGKVKFK
jgi:alpha-D-xyloside xylohydrolase